jgi:hypothetical protein
MLSVDRLTEIIPPIASTDMRENAIHAQQQQRHDAHMKAEVNSTETELIGLHLIFSYDTTNLIIFGRTQKLRGLNRNWTASVSSGPSCWLHIQMSWVRFPALRDFLSSSGSGPGSNQPREDKCGAT